MPMSETVIVVMPMANQLPTRASRNSRRPGLAGALAGGAGLAGAAGFAGGAAAGVPVTWVESDIVLRCAPGLREKGGQASGPRELFRRSPGDVNSFPG